MKIDQFDFSDLKDKLILITDSREVAGWLELLFLGEAERFGESNSDNFPIYLYAGIPRDNFLPRIDKIEKLCPNEFYILHDHKLEGSIMARIETEDGFKTVYGLREIEKYIKIDIDLPVH